MANGSIIDAVLVALFLTFEDRGLATMSAPRQPLMIMRIFKAIDRNEHVNQHCQSSKLVTLF